MAGEKVARMAEMRAGYLAAHSDKSLVKILAVRLAYCSAARLASWRVESMVSKMVEMMEYQTGSRWVG